MSIDANAQESASITQAEDADVASFRAELIAWLASELTDEVIAGGMESVEDGANLALLRAWNAKLADARWAAPAWPKEFGGRDASIAQQLAWREEMTAARAPGVVNVIGVANIGPAIMTVGSQAQKERYLIPMLRGDKIWSQGMSEPDAGSDLASLKTRAELRGDTFIINGQKTWNSLGHHADHCQLYVRTDPEAPKHKGISCLLIDMETPGIEVRPLRTMTGDYPFAEVFFADVEVPADSLLGTLNEGWRVAMTTLSFERAGVAQFHLGLSDRLERLLADAEGRDGLNDPVLRDRIVKIFIEIACMRYSTTRELEAIGLGRQPSVVMGSTAKLMWAGAEQDLADLAIDLLGVEALSGPWAKNLAAAQSTSIAGGTTQINRNILAEHGLGLPR